MTELTGLGERSVQGALQELGEGRIAKGKVQPGGLKELEIERRGQHQTYIYHLILPPLAKNGKSSEAQILRVCKDSEAQETQPEAQILQSRPSESAPKQSIEQSMNKGGEASPRLLWQVGKDLKTIRETLKDARIECGQGETSEGRWTPRLTGADKDRIDALKDKVAALKRERETARI